MKLRVKRETADSLSTLKKDICVIKVCVVGVKYFLLQGLSL